MQSKFDKLLCKLTIQFEKFNKEYIVKNVECDEVCQLNKQIILNKINMVNDLLSTEKATNTDSLSIN